MKNHIMKIYLESLSSLIEDYKCRDLTTRDFIRCIDNIAQNMKLDEQIYNETNINK